MHVPVENSIVLVVPVDEVQVVLAARVHVDGAVLTAVYFLARVWLLILFLLGKGFGLVSVGVRDVLELARF